MYKTHIHLQGDASLVAIEVVTQRELIKCGTNIKSFGDYSHNSFYTHKYFRHFFALRKEKSILKLLLKQFYSLFLDCKQVLNFRIPFTQLNPQGIFYLKKRRKSAI